MKILISIVIGVAAGLSTTFGQGYIKFDNYNSHAGRGAATRFGSGVAGYEGYFGLTSGWTAGLLYSTSPVIDAATANSADAAASLNPAWSVATNTALYGVLAQGYYASVYDFILSDGVDGQVVYFQVIAFETGAVGADSAERYANSTIRGHSASFTGVLSSIPSWVYMDNLESFSVFTIPEPSTLALAGLALAALMACRRNQA